MARFSGRGGWLAGWLAGCLALAAGVGRAGEPSAYHDAAHGGALVEIDVGAGPGDGVCIGGIIAEACFDEPQGAPSCISGTLKQLRACNAAGGLDGRPVRLFVLDGYDKPDGAARAARRFLDDPRILAVIGPHGSGEARAVIAGPLKDGGLVFVSSTATGDGLIGPDGWFFSALWPDSYQASTLAGFLAKERGYTRGCIVVEEHSAYSRDLGAAFVRAFAGHGGRTEEVRLPSHTDNDIPFDGFAEYVGRVMAAKPQFVYLPDSAIHVSRFVRQAGRLGLPSEVTLCGGDTWDHLDVYGGSGRRLEGSLFTSPFVPDAGNRERTRRFMREMALTAEDVRSVSLDTMLSYDTAGMVLEALRRGGLSREGARRGWFMLKDLPLVTGDTTVRSDGLVQKDVFILKVVAKDNGYQSALVKRVPME